MSKKYFSWLLLVVAVVLFSCTKKDDSGVPGADNVYDFTSTVTGVLKSASLAPNPQSELRSQENTMCQTIFCVTPSAVSGKYYAVGLLIQSAGNGMLAYLGQGPWSDITSNSTAYDFSLNNPISHTGTLGCCGGSGDLNDPNTYFSDVAYMIGYMDITFTLTSGMGVHGTAIGTHTLRLVLAEGAITGASRGDMLYKDTDTNFKWISSSDGILSSTRPTSPLQLDSAVTNYTNPFGSQGNQQIPVIYAGINSTNLNGDPLVVTEAELREDGKTYEFYFNAENLVIFPTILKNQDEGMVDSVFTMLKKFHIQGLPYTGAGMYIGTTPSAPNTTLNIF